MKKLNRAMLDDELCNLRLALEEAVKAAREAEDTDYQTDARWAAIASLERALDRIDRVWS